MTVACVRGPYLYIIEFAHGTRVHWGGVDYAATGRCRESDIIMIEFFIRKYDLEEKYNHVTLVYALVL